MYAPCFICALNIEKLSAGAVGYSVFACLKGIVLVVLVVFSESLSRPQVEGHAVTRRDARRGGGVAAPEARRGGAGKQLR